MKNKFFRSLAIVICFASVCIFAGCNENENSSSSSPVPVTTVENQSATEALTDENVLKMLHTYDANSSDPFSGAWQITDGEGSQFKNFVFMFDGKETSTLFTGNTGYLEKYEISKDIDENEIFTTQLMFGINGSYTFETDKTNSTIKLTNTETQKTTTITKLQSFDCIPIPKQDAVIDDKILGAWMSDDGEYYYFDKNGILYQNMYGKFFTYSTYTTEDGKITSTYSTGNEQSTETQETIDNYTYTINDEKLTLNGYEYKKIAVSELK